MRQFVSAVMPAQDGTIVIQGKDFKYLRQVLRVQKNQTLDVRLPDGQLKAMRVAQVGTSRIILSSDGMAVGARNVETGVTATFIEENTAFRTKLWLFQFLPKAQSMDLIVRQATEAGVAVIVPITGSRSPLTDAASRNERWNRIIREARQQCGSPVATKITEPCCLHEAMALWQQNKGANPCAIVLNEDAAGCSPIHLAMAAQDNASAAALAVGCEGGISPEELDVLKTENFRPVHFKTNILRAETAALYGLAALQILLTEHEIWQLKESTC